MEEIKVGEYCRTEAGYISKIIKKHKDLIEFDEKIISRYGEESTYLYSDDFFGDETKEIIKHSPNIIELLEKGDIATFKYGRFEVVKPLTEEDIVDLKCGEYKLVDVLTKEQYEAIKYTVGE